MFDCNDKCASGRLAAPQRNNYFYGKLLDETALQLEQAYQNQQRWMLNRLSLGKGVLCGLTVTHTEERVRIAPGVAIDGCGREIVVPDPIPVDPWQTTDDCGRPSARLPAGGVHEVYFCLAHVDCPTDFTPVLVTDCDRSNRAAPSTIIEKYAVIVKEATPGMPLPLPPALDQDLCDALSGADAETTPEDRRKNVCGVLSSRVCADGKSTSSVVIASRITLTDGKITAVDVCSARPVVYSNPELFEMLLCRSAGGGKDGLGLDPDLPKILDIAWRHNGGYQYLDFVKPYYDVFDSSGKVDENKVKEKIIAGKDVPPLTIYFNHKMTGITRQTLTVRIKLPFVIPDATAKPPVRFFGIYLESEFYGDIVLVDAIPQGTQTPHTFEPYAFAASFIPSIEVFKLILPVYVYLGYLGQQYLELASPTISVALKGDFVWSPAEDDSFSEKAVLDADNIGGRVGQNITRGGLVKGGKNPSGNLTQGGDFESWLKVTWIGDVVNASGSFNTMASHMTASGPNNLNFAGMPVSIGFATRADFLAAGLNDAQANNLIAERTKRPFVDLDDFRGRVTLSNDALRKLKTKFIVF